MKKRIRKITTYVVALTMLICAISIIAPFSMQEKVEAKNVSTATQLIDALTQGTSYIKLTKNITLNERVEFNGNITLDGNNHTITKTKDKYFIDPYEESRYEMFFIASGNSCVIKNITINGNQSTKGRLIYLQDSTSSLRIENSVLTNNAKGGIHTRWNTTLTLNNTTISNCTTSGQGGGIYSHKGHVILTNGSSVISCKSTGSQGGGIYITATGSSLSPFDSGAPSLTITNSYIGCYIKDKQIVAAGNTAEREGGGVYAGEGPVGCTITDSTISNNVATQEGGGFFLSTGAARITDAKIQRNRSGKSGGGIFSGYKANLTVTGTAEDKCLVENNSTTKSSGGGIRCNAGASSANGYHIKTGGTTNLNKVTIRNNTAGGAFGGGVSVQGAHENNTSIFSMVDCKVQNNTINPQEGAQIETAFGGAGVAIKSNIQATGTHKTQVTRFENNVFDNNEVDNSQTDYEQFLNGGALFTEIGFTVKNCTFTNNTTSSSRNAVAGAIFNHTYKRGMPNNADGDSNSTYAWSMLKIEGVSIEGNRAANNGLGGGVYAIGDTKLQDVTIKQNRAREGGGIYNTGKMILAGGVKIKENSACTTPTYGMGSGIAVKVRKGANNEDFTNQPTLTTRKDTGSKNEVSENTKYGPTSSTAYILGGGIYIGEKSGSFTPSASFEDSSLVISNNTVARSGGAIWNGGIVESDGTEYKSNAVSGADNQATYGAGITNAGTYTSKNDVIQINNHEENNGSQLGGGVYNAGTFKSFHNTNGNITSNKSKKGAGLYNASEGKVYLGSSNIIDNTASEDGGGIYNEGFIASQNLDGDSEVNIKVQANKNNNASTGHGPGIANRGSSATITIDKDYKLLVTNNRSKTKDDSIGEIENSSNATFNINANNMSVGSNVTNGNEQDGNGYHLKLPAIVNQSGATMDIKSCVGESNIYSNSNITINNYGANLSIESSADSNESPINIDNYHSSGTNIVNDNNAILSLIQGESAGNNGNIILKNKQTTTGYKRGVYNKSSIIDNLEAVITSNSNTNSSFSNAVENENGEIRNLTSDITHTERAIKTIGGKIAIGSNTTSSLGHYENNGKSSLSGSFIMMLGPYGTATMYSGTVSNNNADLGTVHTSNNATFTQYGGEIKDNTARLGGCAYVQTPSTYQQCGGVIKDNEGDSTKYSGVYLTGSSEENRGRYLISGTITNKDINYLSNYTYVEINNDVSPTEDIKVAVEEDSKSKGRIIADLLKGSAENTNSSSDYYQDFELYEPEDYSIRPSDKLNQSTLAKLFTINNNETNNKGVDLSDDTLISTHNSTKLAIFISKGRKINFYKNTEQPADVVSNMPGVSSENTGECIDGYEFIRDDNNNVIGTRTDKYWGEDFQVPTTKPKRDQYAFDVEKSWNTKSDGTGGVYDIYHTSITEDPENNADLDLYAIWNSDCLIEVVHHMQKLNGQYNRGLGYDFSGEHLPSGMGERVSYEYKDVLDDEGKLLNVNEFIDNYYVNEGISSFDHYTVSNFDGTKPKLKGDGNSRIDLYYTRDIHTLTLKGENGIQELGIKGEATSLENVNEYSSINFDSFETIYSSTSDIKTVNLTNTVYFEQKSDGIHVLKDVDTFISLAGEVWPNTPVYNTLKVKIKVNGSDINPSIYVAEHSAMHQYNDYWRAYKQVNLSAGDVITFNISSSDSDVTIDDVRFGGILYPNATASNINTYSAHGATNSSPYSNFLPLVEPLSGFKKIYRGYYLHTPEENIHYITNLYHYFTGVDSFTITGQEGKSNHKIAINIKQSVFEGEMETGYDSAGFRISGNNNMDYKIIGTLQTMQIKKRGYSTSDTYNASASDNPNSITYRYYARNPEWDEELSVDLSEVAKEHAPYIGFWDTTNGGNTLVSTSSTKEYTLPNTDKEITAKVRHTVSARISYYLQNRDLSGYTKEIGSPTYINVNSNTRIKLKDYVASNMNSNDFMRLSTTKPAYIANRNSQSRPTEVSMDENTYIENGDDIRVYYDRVLYDYTFIIGDSVKSSHNQISYNMPASDTTQDDAYLYKIEKDVSKNDDTTSKSVTIKVPALVSSQGSSYGLSAETPGEVLGEASVLNAYRDNLYKWVDITNDNRDVQAIINDISNGNLIGLNSASSLSFSTDQVNQNKKYICSVVGATSNIKHYFTDDENKWGDASRTDSIGNVVLGKTTLDLKTYILDRETANNQVFDHAVIEGETYSKSDVKGMKLTITNSNKNSIKFYYKQEEFKSDIYADEGIKSVKVDIKNTSNNSITLNGTEYPETINNSKNSLHSALWSENNLISKFKLKITLELNESALEEHKAFASNPISYSLNTYENANSKHHVTERDGNKYVFTLSLDSNDAREALNRYKDDNTLPIIFTTNIVDESYNIHFDSNKPAGTLNSDVIGTMDDVSCPFNEYVVLPPNEFFISGYTFVGWSDSPNNNNVKYEDEGSIYNLASSSNETVTLYAVWERDINYAKLPKIYAPDRYFQVGEDIDYDNLFEDVIITDYNGNVLDNDVAGLGIVKITKVLSKDGGNAKTTVFDDNGHKLDNDKIGEKLKTDWDYVYKVTIKAHGYEPDGTTESGDVYKVFTVKVWQLHYIKSAVRAVDYTHVGTLGWYEYKNGKTYKNAFNDTSKWASGILNTNLIRSLRKEGEEHAKYVYKLNPEDVQAIRSKSKDTGFTWSKMRTWFRENIDAHNLITH